MRIEYRVSDIDGGYHGTFNRLKDAQEKAQETSDELRRDLFITETKIEIIECVVPN